MILYSDDAYRRSFAGVPYGNNIDRVSSLGFSCWCVFSSGLLPPQGSLLLLPLSTNECERTNRSGTSCVQRSGCAKDDSSGELSNRRLVAAGVLNRHTASRGERFTADISRTSPLLHKLSRTKGLYKLQSPTRLGELALTVFTPTLNSCRTPDTRAL